MPREERTAIQAAIDPSTLTAENVQALWYNVEIEVLIIQTTIILNPFITHLAREELEGLVTRLQLTPMGKERIPDASGTEKFFHFFVNRALADAPPT